MKKVKILIIEDDKSLVRIIEEALDIDKFKVVLALSADEGLDKAFLEKPDLIVLDIMLPGQSGFNCLKKLKENKKTKNIPVIILSNLGQDEEIRQGQKLGAIDYLVKADFTIDEIINKIVKYTSKKK
ncbi:MAG: response regulator [Parcubacteria group bacterium]|jgi:DNA-binding response OmpR family regulator|nr:response regulator [Parcubacteria group bacterium]|tara:strand:+ start:6199 stop:6579 length:381 start_codon:yes stop_codon:yes gene_type:complete